MYDFELYLKSTVMQKLVILHCTISPRTFTKQESSTALNTSKFIHFGAYLDTIQRDLNIRAHGSTQIGRWR